MWRMKTMVTGAMTMVPTTENTVSVADTRVGATEKIRNSKLNPFNFEFRILSNLSDGDASPRGLQTE